MAQIIYGIWYLYKVSVRRKATNGRLFIAHWGYSAVAGGRQVSISGSLGSGMIILTLFHSSSSSILCSALAVFSGLDDASFLLLLLLRMTLNECLSIYNICYTAFSCVVFPCKSVMYLYLYLRLCSALPARYCTPHAYYTPSHRLENSHLWKMTYAL